MGCDGTYVALQLYAVANKEDAAAVNNPDDAAGADAADGDEDEDER